MNWPSLAPVRLRWLAQCGNAQAMHELALWYYHGDGRGRAPDTANAAVWWARAAEAKHAVATRWLARCYRRAWGVNLDAQRERALFRRAANLGDNYSLGMCYCYGIGCEPDPVQEVRYFTLAAAAGEPAAIISLGYCYDVGIGFDKDLRRAFELYLRGAELGDALGMHNVGCCYRDGDSVEADQARAFYWFAKAAAHGDAAALCNLGCCYENGRGTASPLLWSASRRRRSSRCRGPPARSPWILAQPPLRRRSSCAADDLLGETRHERARRQGSPMIVRQRSRLYACASVLHVYVMCPSIVTTARHDGVRPDQPHDHPCRSCCRREQVADKFRRGQRRVTSRRATRSVSVPAQRPRP